MSSVRALRLVVGRARTLMVSSKLEASRHRGGDDGRIELGFGRAFYVRLRRSLLFLIIFLRISEILDL